MALTRKFLTALGIEADKIEEIITAHTEVTDALKKERDGYKEDAEKLDAVQKELDALKAEAEKNNGKNPFEVKYQALREEYEKYKTEQAEKETTAKKQTAYKALLQKAGVSEKRLDAVLKVTDLDAVELDENGAIKGADELEKSIVEEWADFIPAQTTTGAKTATPPAGSGGTRLTKDQIFAIKDPSARQKAIAENLDIFGY